MTDRCSTISTMRPSISVVVPFFGTDDEFTELIEHLGAVAMGDDDAVYVVWNSSSAPPISTFDPSKRLTVLHAPKQQSSYYARNVGAATATTDWLLFIDGDCVPQRDLLDAYFTSDSWHEDVVAIAGRIIGEQGDTLAERFSLSRRYLDQAFTLDRRPLGYGQTANLLVRRDWWTRLGGFTEGIVSAGDADFCWRAQLAGGHIEYCERATVVHQHRRSIASLWRQSEKYGRGNHWLQQKFGADFGASRLSYARRIGLSIGGAFWYQVRGRREEASFCLLDALCSAGFIVGTLRGNAAKIS